MRERRKGERWNAYDDVERSTSLRTNSHGRVDVDAYGEGGLEGGES